MQVTAGSLERVQTQAGAAIGDSHRPERIEAGHPQKQESSEDSKQASRFLPGWRTRRPAREPPPPLCTRGGSDPGAEAYLGSSCGWDQRRPFRSKRPKGSRERERVKGKHRGTRRGPQGSGPASPSHGELDHSESGACAAQLRLEIRVAPDRLHSHHSQRARKGGRDATGFKTEGEDRQRKGGGSGRPRPGRRR